ncbi:MAG: succinate dehydrogenase, cytochrome b556 subunit [Alphaproteobacteria bacterium]
MIDNRPLSPHLSIHKKVLTAVFSIFHRLTGIFLTLGSFFLVFWFLSVLIGENFYNYFQIVSSNLIFKVILFFWTLAFFYHLFNGIRYLFWSFSLGMELKTVYLSGYIVSLLTIIATIIVWYL